MCISSHAYIGQYATEYFQETLCIFKFFLCSSLPPSTLPSELELLLHPQIASCISSTQGGHRALLGFPHPSSAPVKFLQAANWSVVKLTFFVFCLSGVTVLGCLIMSRVLKTVVSCVLLPALLIVTVGRMNLVPVTLSWLVEVRTVDFSGCVSFHRVDVL